MKLYTRTGDDGTTGLFDGSRVDKDHPRVTAYGEVDELNAALGLALASLPERAGGGAAAQSARWETLRQRLVQVQAELFTLGADLATPSAARQRAAVPTIGIEHVARLEQWIDEACAATPPLRGFVLPAGAEPACRLHLARTIARRAERSVIGLNRREPVGPDVLAYLNRLNDLLFAWARLANALGGVADVPWVRPG